MSGESSSSSSSNSGSAEAPSYQSLGVQHNCRFHPNHGENVNLIEDGVVARRDSSFANALTFSASPILPGELFLVEIECNEQGWSGFLRLGLTQLNPETIHPLPQYALPDLTKMGQTWVYGITKYRNYVYQGEDAHAENRENENDDRQEYSQSSVLGVRGDTVFTAKGPVKMSMLLPSPVMSRGPCPTDEGSRVGLIYVPRTPEYADMHFIINGEDQGPCCRTIPYRSGPLYAVIDIYGSTKQVRLLQLYQGVPSLLNICREVILQTISNVAVNRLPIPPALKDFLRYRI
ncbi:neuralized-like protein 2 [Cloeon dipterum]|uniref:neuralized-like protein 2 n=1 Tax=Cloeon dipterum TaxID=197152 RepID=UPI00321FF263